MHATNESTHLICTKDESKTSANAPELVVLLSNWMQSSVRHKLPRKTNKILCEAILVNSGCNLGGNSQWAWLSAHTLRVPPASVEEKTRVIKTEIASHSSRAQSEFFEVSQSASNAFFAKRSASISMDPTSTTRTSDRAQRCRKKTALNSMCLVLRFGPVRWMMPMLSCSKVPASVKESGPQYQRFIFFEPAPQLPQSHFFASSQNLSRVHDAPPGHAERVGVPCSIRFTERRRGAFSCSHRKTPNPNCNGSTVITPGLPCGYLSFDLMYIWFEPQVYSRMHSSLPTNCRCTRCSDCGSSSSSLS